MPPKDVMIEIVSLWKLYELRGAGHTHATGGGRGATASAEPEHEEAVRSGRAFWALRDISFSVARGEVVGLIGANGAGKSTLLRVLSRVTYPTHGTVRIYGSMVSLLEVGTGFHDELTGRENITLNATILGMRPEDLKRRFDDIVAFSGIGDFIDTPVKYLSSGMRVRLGFSVAVHVDPEILIIDEVLAVGDAEFKERCKQRIAELVGARDRTVIVVSHNMRDVEALCSRIVLLQKGEVIADGSPEETIDRYLSRSASRTGAEGAEAAPSGARNDAKRAKLQEALVQGSAFSGPAMGNENDCWSLAHRQDRSGSGRLRFETMELIDKNGSRVHEIGAGEPLTIAVSYAARSGATGECDCRLAIVVRSESGEPIFWLPSRRVNQAAVPLARTGRFVWSLPHLPLLPGTYLFDIWCQIEGQVADKLQEAAVLVVRSQPDLSPGDLRSSRYGYVLVPFAWSSDDSRENTGSRYGATSHAGLIIEAAETP